MEKKQKKGVARLFEIAGERKGLLILAGILSAGSACCMLVPYLSVYQVANELLQNAGNISQADSGHMIRWGWIAFAGLTGGLLLLYASLMASHVAAFRILYGLRIKLAEHIGRLPLGYLNGTSTGAIKKTMEQNRNIHRPHHPRSGERIGNGGHHVHLILHPQRVDSSSLSVGYRIGDRSSMHHDVRQGRSGIYADLLRYTGKDERLCRAICTGNAGSQDIRAKHPFFPAV